MPDPLAPLVTETPPGVRVAPLPTPFPVGPVNCYVLTQPPVTVVDPGMFFDESLARLHELLADAGLRASDVEQIVVTHGHPDHYGAAQWLAERADAPIFCGRAEIPKLLHVFDGPQFSDLIEDLGVPLEVRDAFPVMYEAIRDLVVAPEESRIRPLDDGDSVSAGGRMLEVHVTPGHAVGHVSLFDAEDRTLFSGDHLLPRITPNPVLEPDDGDVVGRRRSLVEYLASLDRFVEMDPRLVLPGHGPTFTDVPTLAERMHAHHAARATEIRDLLHTVGPASAYELACRLFPGQEGFGVILGVSEVVGHLDLLARDELVERLDGVPSLYRARRG